MIIDTHTHLYLPEYEADGVGAVRRALDAGVGHMVFPNVDIATIGPMKQLASQFPENISMAMGLHPTEVKEGWQDDLAKVLGELGDGSEYVAVGEVGIDLYWDKTFEEQQMLALDKQLQRAESLDLPVIIHCREGQQQTLEVLQGHRNIKAVFHSFGGTPQDVDAIRRVGDYYFGINGIVTFKNCKVRDTLGEITLDRLLLETDAPYLSPVPHRGKRNESAYIVHTAHHIAQNMDVPFETLCDKTTANATEFFRLRL